MNKSLSRFHQGILRMDGTICFDFKNQLFVVGFLFHTIVFDAIFYIFDRCKDRIGRDGTHRHIRFGIFLSGNITHTLINGDIHFDSHVGFHITDNQIGVKYLKSCYKFLKITRSQLFLTGYRDRSLFMVSTFRLQFETHLLQVQNDFSNIFNHPSDGREFVFY